MPLIALEAIGRTYSLEGATIRALHGVTFNVGKGESLAIVGRSGSGKSTLMNLIGLLDLPTEGRFFLDGIDVVALSETGRSATRARTIGFVFQSYHLLPRYTALENVALPLIYSGVRASERRRRALACLDQVGMGHRAGHFPQQLSGGEQQRIAIARALISNPSIILADEPTGALDSQTGADILRALLALRADGHTLIIVTHDRDVASRCDRIISLLDGHVTADRATGDAAEDAP